LYEGTTAIQAQDFFFRKIIRDKGQALAHVAGQIQQFIDNGEGFDDERTLLKTALEDVQGMAAKLTGWLMAAQEDPKQLYLVGTASVRFLMAVGDLVIGWLLLRQAVVAAAALANGASGDDVAFYQGKIASATFFAKNMLPQLTAVRHIVENNVDNDLMELDEAAF
ncbi:acyl-CoA dehydrogenase, partial [Gordonia sp. (in: high G+C Gram-positive bacteria)]